MPGNSNQVENRLWAAADELRANSKLKSSEYAVPVLGLIFLRYADQKFSVVQKEIEGKGEGRRKIGPADYQAKGVLYLPEEARFSTLLKLPEGANIGQAINDAMRAVEAENRDLKDVLPKTFNRLETATLVELLKVMASIPMDIEGDAFGKIYEYFLGKFALSEGQKGGEFFTPTSVVRLIVRIIEPYHGRIYDPACGSGGMFVQSARFVEEHKNSPDNVLSVYGQERVSETVRLAKMNLAVHGLAGDIRQGNTYYEDLHTSTANNGKFDFVMANPPFNVDRVDKDRLKDDTRFPFGLPRVDNANYLWIQIFYSALNTTGRAGFVMANSASDARASELEIRKKLIKDQAVDVMVAVGSNFFYTVTLPCTLWFLDRGKKDTDLADKVLFIDARDIYQQVDRAHREFTPEQVEFLGNIARLYRGKAPENLHGSADMMAEKFPDGIYQDIPGLCKVATLKEIKAQGWSLNPGRYVGVADREEEDFDFKERLEELNEELEKLNVEAMELEERIGENVVRLLGGV
ncbi:MAG: SAM-dependent DNA methyltransferase [Desulfobacteraceae bacterium]|nr:SAM-dependent DNA methyltransferase [Desulfobacterales bacterium]MBL6967090.1 SAM-dependent DNA methyltransferase [Desulfobacteraceae bacterium]MBL7101256.1 SAM-dependent DNA methyltransferase [Desulfobacteraceae bacterium]MBL7171837.1 SAM-dependent DNA methyltransferase [Desulfobacteraceae bacterium]